MANLKFVQLFFNWHRASKRREDERPGARQNRQKKGALTLADVATSPSSSSNWSFVRFCFQWRDQATSTSRLIKPSPTFAHSPCAIGQRQTNAQGQQVLAIELLPTADGLEGSLIMPFGLAVTQPVMLAIDEGPPVEDSFSTCVLTGCIVPVEAASEILEAMCTGSSVTISARYR